MPQDHKIALLIDCDNVSYKSIEGVIDELFIMRIREWTDEFFRLGWRKCGQCPHNLRAGLVKPEAPRVGACRKWLHRPPAALQKCRFICSLSWNFAVSPNRTLSLLLQDARRSI